MAWTLRNRQTGYDNIAKGSATGRELTIRGTSQTSGLYGETLGGGSNIGSGTSWHTSGQQDNRFSGQTTFGAEHLTSL